MNQAHKDLQQYLCSSFLYYCRMESVISDTEYDMLAKRLLESYDEWQTHMHAHLVTKEDLEAGTLYKLKAVDYPPMVRLAAEMWMRGE